ncbi:MAG: sel1 repeat family protein, partial [Proteobacteria bacterium]|nr:sel1 repeat family protein [Pseudomonadota bacterium]
RSANLGDSHAQYNLGVMYKKGMVVEKDLFKSFNWFDMAARQNLPEALFMVGNEYEYGNGVTKNTATAMMYYKKAAGLGEKKAIKRLNTP